MKLNIQNKNLTAHNLLDTLIEARLRLLRTRVRIDEATVVIERMPEASPPYRVELHLAVPGPDLRSSQVDNTPVQAFTRALSEIEEHLRDRQRTRDLRGPSKARRTSTPGSRASGFR